MFNLYNLSYKSINEFELKTVISKIVAQDISRSIITKEINTIFLAHLQNDLDNETALLRSISKNIKLIIRLQVYLNYNQPDNFNDLELLHTNLYKQIPLLKTLNIENKLFYSEILNYYIDLEKNCNGNEVIPMNIAKHYKCKTEIYNTIRSNFEFKGMVIKLVLSAAWNIIDVMNSILIDLHSTSIFQKKNIFNGFQALKEYYGIEKTLNIYTEYISQMEHELISLSIHSNGVTYRILQSICVIFTKYKEEIRAKLNNFT